MTERLGGSEPSPLPKPRKKMTTNMNARPMAHDVPNIIPPADQEMQWPDAMTDKELIAMADWYAELDYGFRDYESHAIDKAIH